MSDLLGRVAAALALADNAATDAERETAMEMAQKFARLGQIDLAAARAHTASKEREKPENRQVQVNDYGRRYHRASFVELFLVIARANDLRCLMSSDNYFVFPYGFPTDLDIAEALYVSLAVQMEAAANAGIARGDHKEWVEPGQSYWNQNRGQFVTAERRVQVVAMDARAWRAAFYGGFTARVNARLWEARRAADHEAGADVESSSTALALRDKSVEVDDYFTEAKKQWKRLGEWKGPKKPQRDDAGARDAGIRAGSAAVLGDERGMPEGARRPALT